MLSSGQTEQLLMLFTLCRRSLPLFALFLLVIKAHAAPITDAIAAARAHVHEHLAPRAPGLSIAIGRDGKILWSEGFGFADVAARMPVTPQTRFRIGSVSKPLTAVGLMLLVEQGKIDLDVDIHQYVPDYPDKGAPITTRELAGHLAGIRHYRGAEFLSNRHYDSVRAGLKIFENDPLLFTPGEKYFYSSYGFNLISMVMESAAHKNYLNYMQQAVFTPLQMTNTVPDEATSEALQCSCFYQLKPGTTNFVIAPAVDNSYKWASGGFLSTPEDLVHFGFAMLHPGFLKRASLDAMFTSQKTEAGKATGYGIGWFIIRDAKGHPVWSHSGGAVGGSTILQIHPDTGLVVAFAFNYENALDKESIQLMTDDFSTLADLN
jgi:serine beta-lactamase-like protein LACTB